MCINIVSYKLLNFVALPLPAFVAGTSMISLVTFTTFPFDLESIKASCCVKDM